MYPTPKTDDPMTENPLAARVQAATLCVLVVSEVLDAVTSSPSPHLAARAQGFELSFRACRVVARETGITDPSQFAITTATRDLARGQLRRTLSIELLDAFAAGLNDYRNFEDASKEAAERLEAEDNG